jgi:VWFA-related protein
MKADKMLRPVLLACCICALGPSIAITQEPSAVAQTRPFAAGAAAVVVDAVVRDRKGKPVTDLRKEDFELFEDGVRQDIGDVTVMGVPSGSGSRDLAAAGPKGTPSQLETATKPNAASPSFLAIVFDRLSVEARSAAYRGALAYLETLHENDFAAVYLADLSLTTIQPYTNDRAKLQTALRDVASRATSAFDRAVVRDDLRERDDRGNPLPGDASPGVPVVASAESVGRPVDTRENSAAREIAALDLSTHTSWDALARDQQGYATTNALLAVTTALGTLPGRKSVVFFAEGLAIPVAVLPHFRNVITTANRANVSVYTIDAAGLRVHSKDAEIGREVNAMAAMGLAGGGSLAALERNEDVLRKDPRTSLTLLARQTGGFLVENTNDLAKAFRQVDDDRRFYYLLTYTPKNGDFDGTWRTLTVTVPRQRLTIRARSGYLAVRSAGAVPLLSYEGPALAALEHVPAPTDLPIHATALVFPDGSESRVAVLAAADGRALRFDRDSTSRTYRTDFTIVARILDSSGAVVRKSSQPYRLSGPTTQIEQAQAGEVLFFRQPALGPGRYTLEVAVHDALALRAGVRRSAFVVPESRLGSLQVSSLVIVARGERVAPGTADKESPLYVGDLLVYPNLGTPLRKPNDNTLTFYVAINPAPGAPSQGRVAILRDGQPVSDAAVVFAPADASGAIRHIGRVQVDALPPGQYTLRMTVTQGDRHEARETTFELAR